jgi:hypothetical protein
MYRVHLALAGFELTTLVVIGTDYIVSYKYNYPSKFDFSIMNMNDFTIGLIISHYVSGELECPYYTHKESEMVHEIMDEAAKQIGTASS